jgi:two-component system sensor histidine kinase RpfC
MTGRFRKWVVAQGAASDKAELEQSLIRLGISLLILFYLLAHMPLDALDVYAVTITSMYLAVSVVLTSLVLFFHNKSVLRRLAGAWVDVGAVTALMAFTGDLGVILVGGYLWVIFGNGFRFGRRYLVHAQLLSVVGFILATQANSYWKDHATMQYSMLLMLLALPIYVAALIARIESAKQKANEANAMKTRFVANMSHEIRTPLNGIIGVATLFRTTPLSEEQQKLVDTLDSSSRLLLSLLNNVLDIAKIEEGRLSFEHTEFSVESLMHETANIFRPQIEAKGIHFDVQITSAAGPMLGDPHRLQQVLANLLGNAVKFTERGSIILSFSVLWSNPYETHVRFQVADTGAGIPASAQPRIFESFVQADASTTRRYGGSGLGLTIARHLVEVMGGTLSFESTENVGSRFWVDLTLERAAQTSGGVEVAPFPETVEPETESTLNILVCEDDATNQNILKRLLELAGHQVTLSANGDEMLDNLETASFDVVIADQNMAGMSGTDALKLYRFARPDDKRTRFILFTADATTNARQAAREAGYDAFLSKPVNAATLFATIASIVGLPANISDYWLNTAMNTSSAAPVSDTRDKAGILLDDATLKDLETLGAGDPLFVDRLLRNYLHDSEELLAKIELAVTQKHFDSVREYCHALKGNSLSIGAFAVCECAERIDRASLGELRFRGAAMVKSLHADYERTCVAIDNYMIRRKAVAR